MRSIKKLLCLIILGICLTAGAQHRSGPLNADNIIDSRRELRKEHRRHSAASRISHDSRYATRKLCYSARAGHKPRHKRINESVAVNKRK